MKNNDLIDQILMKFRSIIDDRERLEILRNFMDDELLADMESENLEIIVPEKYKELIRKIGDSMSAGFVFFLNLDTLEEFEIPKELLDEIGDNSLYEEDEEEEEDEKDEDDRKYETEDEPWIVDFKKIEDNWTNKIVINPPESHISFDFMDQFVDSLPESYIKNRLRNTLEGRKPFRHFNHLIHESDEREDWFAFRQKCLENYVAEILAESLWNKEATD